MVPVTEQTPPVYSNTFIPANVLISSSNVANNDGIARKINSGAFEGGQSDDDGGDSSERNERSMNRDSEDTQKSSNYRFSM